MELSDDRTLKESHFAPNVKCEVSVQKYIVSNPQILNIFMISKNLLFGIVAVVLCASPTLIFQQPPANAAPAPQTPKAPQFTERDFALAQQVTEIFGFSLSAGLVALRRNNWNLDDTVTKLATEESFLNLVMDEAEKVSKQQTLDVVLIMM